MRNLLLGAASALAITVLTQGAPVDARTPADQLIVGMNMNNMLSLDPHEVGQFEPSHVFSNVYDTLLGTDPHDPATLVPEVAHSWEVDSEGGITFHLRDDITFHSGRKLTAADVVGSFHRLLKMNLSPSNHFKSWGYSVDNMEELIYATDERTVVMRMARPFNPELKLYFLATSLGTVLDMEEVMAHERDGDLGKAWLTTNSAGSGPFRLNMWNPNDIAILDRHDGYWDQVAEMRRVVVRHIPESQAARLQLERNDIDVAYTLSGADFDGLEGNPDVEIVRVPGGGYYYLSVNMKDPDLGKAEVREAIRWCIDYEGINEAFMRNYGIPRQRQIPLGIPGTIEEDLGYTLDIDRCREGLAAAGYPNGLSKTMRVLTLPPFIETATAIQGTMDQAGIKVELLPGDGGSVYGAMRDRNFEFLVGRSGGGFIPDAHDFMRSTWYNPDNRDEAKLTGQLAWRASWYEPEINALIEEAVAELDTGRRIELYREIQDLIEEKVPYVMPISQRIDPFAVHARVKNYVGNPTWMARWEWVEKD
jgi:peptide/nickel transport system substrate-binding protein